MTGIKKHIAAKCSVQYVVTGIEHFHICSFTEFLPFCHKLYFISNYKDFQTHAQA